MLKQKSILFLIEKGSMAKMMASWHDKFTPGTAIQVRDK
jgi:hypothetical protein